MSPMPAYAKTILNFLKISVIIFSLHEAPQAQLEFFGYYEAEIDQIAFSDIDYIFGYNKLRLDFTSRPREYLFLGGNINIQKYSGKTSWDFLDFLPPKIKDEFEPGDQLILEIRDSLYLDNLFLRASLQRLDITIGRQPISLGTGYAWNPLDIFNNKDLLDPTYEQPGINALRVEIALTGRAGADIIIEPDRNWKMSKKMVQLKKGIGRFDISLNWAQQYHLYPFWKFKGTEKTHTLTNFAGASLVGQIGELGLWAEVLRSYAAPANYGEYVAGLDHTFDNGIYVMAEYLHNTLGVKKDEVGFVNYAHFFAGETMGILENYLFSAAQFSLSDFLSAGLFGFSNLDDGSFSVVPQIEWTGLENMSFSLLLSGSGGPKNSEFSVQGRTLRIRYKAYF